MSEEKTPIADEKPICFRITLLPDQIDEALNGIIQFSETELEIMQRSVDKGTVLAVGDSAFNMDRFGNECPVKAGDYVRFKKGACHWCRDTDEFGRGTGPWYAVINDDDVLTIIKRGEE